MPGTHRHDPARGHRAIPRRHPGARPPGRPDVRERSADLAADPENPALLIVADEYAEMPAEARDDADWGARRGRAVAVNMMAATQRPTQEAMGGNAVRSQMDVRICLRVRERRDVDLILGQGSFAAGWHANALTQPGAFLISAPEITVPERARGYLITDARVARQAARYAGRWPEPRPRPVRGRGCRATRIAPEARACPGPRSWAPRQERDRRRGAQRAVGGAVQRPG